jgi:hypothetical protein
MKWVNPWVQRFYPSASRLTAGDLSNAVLCADGSTTRVTFSRYAKKVCPPDFWVTIDVPQRGDPTIHASSPIR